MGLFDFLIGGTSPDPSETMPDAPDAIRRQNLADALLRSGAAMFQPTLGYKPNFGQVLGNFLTGTIGGYQKGNEAYIKDMQDYWKNKAQTDYSKAHADYLKAETARLTGGPTAKEQLDYVKAKKEVEGMGRQEQEQDRAGLARQLFGAMQSDYTYPDKTTVSQAVWPLLAETAKPEELQHWGIGKSQTEGAYKTGHIQQFQQGRNVVYKEWTGKEWKPRPDLGGGPKDNPTTIVGMGGFGKLGEDQKNTWYEQYELTGKLPPFAWRDAEGRNQFMSGYATWLKDQGRGSVDALVNRAGFKADSMALNDLTKREQLIGTFTNRIEATSGVVENIAKKYGNRDSRLLNIPINKLAETVGSGEYQALKLALKSLSNEVAKVESGSLGIQEVSVQQSQYMEKIHDPNLSLADLQVIIQTGKDLGKTNMQSIGKQRNDLKGRMGKGTADKSAMGGNATKSGNRFTVEEVK